MKQPTICIRCGLNKSLKDTNDPCIEGYKNHQWGVDEIDGMHLNPSDDDKCPCICHDKRYLEKYPDGFEYDNKCCEKVNGLLTASVHSNPVLIVKTLEDIIEQIKDKYLKDTNSK